MINCSTTTNTDPILDDFSNSCRLKWVQQSRCLIGYLQVNRYQPVTWLVPGRERSSVAAPWGRESAFVTKPSHLGYLHFNAGARLGGAVFVRKQAGVTAKGGCPTPPMSSHPARVPFPPFNCTVTGKNQPLIRQCYLIKTAPRLALALITSNLEKDGGRGKTEWDCPMGSCRGQVGRAKGRGWGRAVVWIRGWGLQSADIMTQRGEGQMWHLSSLISWVGLDPIMCGYLSLFTTVYCAAPPPGPLVCLFARLVLSQPKTRDKWLNK